MFFFRASSSNDGCGVWLRRFSMQLRRVERGMTGLLRRITGTAGVAKYIIFYKQSSSRPAKAKSPFQPCGRLQSFR
jgi:hypothetical protein